MPCDSFYDCDSKLIEYLAKQNQITARSISIPTSPTYDIKVILTCNNSEITKTFSINKETTSSTSVSFENLPVGATAQVSVLAYIEDFVELAEKFLGSEQFVNCF